METQNVCQQDLNWTGREQGSVIRGLRCYSWRRIPSLAIKMGTSSCKMSIKILTDVNLVLKNMVINCELRSERPDRTVNRFCCFSKVLGVRVRAGNQIHTTGFSLLELAAKFKAGPKKADREGSLFPAVNKVQSETQCCARRDKRWKQGWWRAESRDLGVWNTQVTTGKRSDGGQQLLAVWKLG